MKSEKKIDKSNIELRVELDPEEWTEEIKQAASKLSQGLNIAGFRPGKAPQDVVMSHLGETRVISEAAETAINKFYIRALKEHDIVPIVPPKISADKVAKDVPLIFKAEVVVMPAVELGDYQQIRVEQQPIKIDAERVDGVLKNIQRQQAQFNPVERAVQMGDWVEIDFVGKIDDKPFEGGSSKRHPLIIGDGVLLPEFEQALMGMKVGQEKTFPVTFPADYHKQEFANKLAKFTATLHKIKAVVLPELSDELASSAGNFATLDALKADIYKFLQEDSAKQEIDRQKEEAITKLVALTKVGLPESLIEQELEAMWHDFEHQLEHQHIALADYLKQISKTESELKKEWEPTAKKRVIAGLALNTLRTKEGIEAGDIDVDQEIVRLQELYPAEQEHIKTKYQHPGERQRLQTILSGQKAIDRLWEIATQK